MNCECSICLDDITAATGSTTLSCGHVFHFGCIAKWFANQETTSSCSLCRKEMGATEDLPFDEDEYEEDEDEDDDEYEEEEEEEEEVDPAIIQARVEAVKTRLSTMDKDAAEAFAATKIQSIGRLYLVKSQARNAYWAKEYMKRCEERLRKSQLEFKVAHQALVSGRNWKKQVALRFQALWRGYRTRNVALAMVHVA